MSRDLFGDCPACGGSISRERYCKSCGVSLPRDTKDARKLVHQIHPARNTPRVTRNRDFMLTSLFFSNAKRWG